MQDLHHHRLGNRFRNELRSNNISIPGIRLAMLTVCHGKLPVEEDEASSYSKRATSELLLPFTVIKPVAIQKM